MLERLCKGGGKGVGGDCKGEGEGDGGDFVKDREKGVEETL